MYDYGYDERQGFFGSQFFGPGGMFGGQPWMNPPVGPGPGPGPYPGGPGPGPGPGPGFGGGASQMPSSPPPGFTPSKPVSTGATIYAVDPGAIYQCVYRFVYLWLRGGRQFWAWLTFVGPRSAAGYRWTGFRWVYFGVDLNDIEYFECY